MDLNDIRLYIDDRPGEQIFRVHHSVFTDPELFELELKYIFGRTWVFLGLESQVRKPNDFVTTWIARTPVLVTRDGAGKVHAFINACRHKGATVCRADQGNSKFHVCAYHGWAYDSAGRISDIKDRPMGRYGRTFDASDHDLLPLARVQSYKGLIFGSLSPDVPELGEFLGDLRFYFDCAMEQGPEGMEFVPGRTLYTYEANWKMQMDNGLDFYHLTSTHTSFLDVQARRRAGEGNQEARQFDWQKRMAQEAGTFQFRNGHSATWMNQPEPGKRPIFPAYDEIRRREGELKAEWMVKKLRNATVFPNMQMADSTSLLIRTFRPITVDRTEMRVHCLAPIGESVERRAWRLRQFEDFFNPSGLATPDDTVVYEDCQRSLKSQPLGWLQGYERGMDAITPGSDAMAQSAGLSTVSCVAGTFEMQNEVCFHPPHREWARLMAAGIEGRKAYP